MNLCGWGKTQMPKVGFPNVEIKKQNQALYSANYHGQNQPQTRTDQYLYNPTKISISSFQNVGEKLGQTSITTTSSLQYEHPGHISKSHTNSSSKFPSYQMQNIDSRNSEIRPYNWPHVSQQSYSALFEQNLQLKRIIENEYKPLKQLYSKLKAQHDDREYLVSQLQWKVKELANDMKRKRK